MCSVLLELMAGSAVFWSDFTSVQGKGPTPSKHPFGDEFRLSDYFTQIADCFLSLGQGLKDQQWGKVILKMV